MSNPYQVVKAFEAALCDYTGARYAVAVHSCTSALMLAVAWHLREIGKANGACEYASTIEIPKRTYVSVPMAIIHAGGRPTFRDEEWTGAYQLKPLEVWDSARWFTMDIYHALRVKGGGEHPMVCLSFHASKTLGLEYGGCILHDNPEADAWFRRARFHGRTEGVTPKDDTFDFVGYDCRMHPTTAQLGLHRLYAFPKHHAPLPNDPYPDLSQMRIFQ